jgi:hypothetical protein
VTINAAKIASARPTIWARVRIQLGVGLLLAVLVPWAARVQLERTELELAALQNSLAGSLFAVMAGYYGFRRLSRYPGVRSSYNILPSFAASFGIVLAVFFFARLDYSRIQFLASFALSVVWYYVVYFKLQRQQQLSIGVVPFGQVEHLFDIKDVHWVPLRHDDRDADRHGVIVADLRADIPDEWERFLADRALAGTLVMHVKQMEESLTGRVAIEHLSRNTLGSLIPGHRLRKFKRVGDLIRRLLAAAAAPFWRSRAADPPRFARAGFLPAGAHGYRGDLPCTIRRCARPAERRGRAMTRDGDDRVTKHRRVSAVRIDELPQC